MASQFLERFRPAATPGAAAAAGVPVDRTAAAAEELLPVLALLDDAQAAVQRIRERAARQADERRVVAAAQADAVVARARQECPAVRARTVAEARARGEAEQASEVAEAERRAERLRRAADRRMAGAVDRVRSELDAILAELGYHAPPTARAGAVPERGRRGP